jgi:hypothetical protein
MRDPAIHIKRSNLAIILERFGFDTSSVYELVDDIMREACQYSIKNRVFVTTKAKGKRKADRAVESDTKLLDQFNRLYQGILVTHSIKALTIGKTSPQWLTLKEVCFNAKEFSDLNNLGYEEGFKLYIEMGIKLLGNKFGIYRLKGYAQKILEYYQAKTLIENDLYPTKTDQVITAWARAVKEYFHTSIELENDAQRAHFIHAREEADDLKATYDDFIFAQFDKWAYLNTLPSFSQLYGDNSRLIYQTYMAKNHKDNKTKEEQDYFTKVKNNEKEIPIKTTQQEASIREARLRGSM